MEATSFPVPVSLISAAERRWAVGIHLGVLLLALLTSWAAGLAGAIGAGGALLLRPLNSDFVAEHAKEALNFNLSMFIYLIIGVLFSVFTLGLGLLVVVPMAIVLAIAWLVCSIQASIAASDGLAYRYPFTLRLF